MVKELAGVSQVAEVGHHAEGYDLVSGTRIQKGARNCEMGLNLLEMRYGHAFVQQGESSLTTRIHVFGANPIPDRWKRLLAFEHLSLTTSQIMGRARFQPLTP